ncbi:MAG TPA: prepilin-type N-terminal cleavage/methylation domain-containing protein [Thermoanaerobaculia bacterium]|nr:prepilin-type N-terminal cleavage/methylation domain-containing protein [Thermoanaerobaculia bacterium]
MVTMKKDLPLASLAGERMARESRMRAHARTERSQNAHGFTLIELIVVVTIVGLLAGIAVVNVRNAQRKTAEKVCQADLALLRKGIDDFYADKQRYPSSLEELVTEKYLRRIPPDPLTKQADWEEIAEEASTATDASGDEPGAAGPGIVDVKTRAEGQTLDDPPRDYSDF